MVHVMSELAELREYLGIHFTKINERFDGVDQRLEVVDQRLETVEQRLEVVDQRLETVEQRLEVVDQRLEVVDQRLEAVDARLEGVDKHLKHLDECCDHLEVSIRVNNEQLSEMYTGLDAYANKADTYFQEMQLLNRQVRRHENWLHKIASKTQVRLEY
jgi:chromosome segregation ATPase